MVVAELAHYNKIQFAAFVVVANRKRFHKFPVSADNDSQNTGRILNSLGRCA